MLTVHLWLLPSLPSCSDLLVPAPVQPACRPPIQLSNTGFCCLASLGRQHHVRSDSCPSGVTAYTQDVLCSRLVRHSTCSPKWDFISNSRNQKSGEWGHKELMCPSDHWCWLQLPHPCHASQIQLCCPHCAHSRI